MKGHEYSCLGVAFRGQNEGNCKTTDQIDGYKKNNKNQFTTFKSRRKLHQRWLVFMLVLYAG